ncbi:hypothetical protein [Streptomyces caelestis]
MTQSEALTAMVAVLGLFVFMTWPALLGIVRERRIDRQIERAGAARAAAERRDAPAAERRDAPAAERRDAPVAARPARGAASHRTARAA